MHLARKILDEVGRLGQQRLQPGYDGEGVTSGAMNLIRRVAGDCQVGSRANAGIATIASEGSSGGGKVVGVCFELARASHGGKR